METVLVSPFLPQPLTSGYVVSWEETRHYDLLVKNMNSDQTAWVHYLTLLLTRWVTFSNMLSYSRIQFLICKVKKVIIPALMLFLRRLNELVSMTDIFKSILKTNV